MRDEEAFLRAVAAAPDDDAPRLIYADWLDEHGEADRAEFIRAQVELGRPPTALARRRRLAARARELLARNRRRWLGGLARSPVPWAFHRGFVERLGAGGCFRGRVDFKDETVWEHLRFCPDGRVLEYTYQGPKREYGLAVVARRLRPGNRGLRRGAYALHARPGGADIEFTLSRGGRPGGGSERYRGIIRGAVLRVRGGSPAARARPAVAEYRWVRLGVRATGAA